jgi:ubiquinone/menaquinone biosynthesis C-methylase UbiE
LSDEKLVENGQLLPMLYDKSKTYGWHVGMTAVMTSVLADVLLPAQPRILEIGCGSGMMLNALAHMHPAAWVDGLDLHPAALIHAQAMQLPKQQLTQANLHHLPYADEAFDLVVALDAFDQSAVDIAQGLAEARRVLRPNGWLALRVSAYAWLHGAHDVAFNTGRRYDRAALKTIVTAAGFFIQRVTSANTLLAPPVIVLRLLERNRTSNDELYLSPTANRVVQTALQRESVWLRYADLPFGLSLILLAQKAA